MIAASITATAVGCSSDSSGAAGRAGETTRTTAAAPRGPLAAGVAQYREDEITGVVQIELRGTGTQPVVIDQLALRWSGLRDAAPSMPGYTIYPGVTTALATPIGAAVCPAAGSRGPDPATASAVVDLTTTDGARRTLTVPVTAGTEVLQRIHERLCEQQSVAESVHLSFAPGWTMTTLPGGIPAVTGSVVAERGTGSGTIAVTDLATEGVLLSIDTATPGQRPWLVLPAGTTDATVPVVITSSRRCDDHALADDKKSLLFSVTLKIDGRTETSEVTVPPADGATVKSVVGRTCGTG